MSPYRTATALRSMAKGQLLGKYPLAATTFITVFMMTVMLRLLSSNLIGGSGVVALILSTLISFIVSLILGVINVGVSFMALKICCREAIFANDILYGFRNCAEKAVKIKAVLTGAQIILTLPATIAFTYMISGGNDDFISTVIILYIVGFATYAFVSLVFSQVFFLLLDFEGKNPRELLTLSHRLMDGNKKRLFLLWLGFVPLFFLSVLTCCLGFIWVIPYVKVTLANFYMDLMQSRDSD
jgi:uncharacterized membrane protein